jgi:membrane-associated phospholipid phosphatase
MEALFSVALVTQSLKRITGRQSPLVASQAGGKWQFFPNLKTYQNNRAYYDAYPSGHVATLMATVTVLAGNYPEKKWIKPVGYTMLGVLAYDMMQSEVHWASDYPLALAIGYIIGNNIVKRNIKRIEKKSLLSTKKVNFKTNFTFALRPDYKAIGVRVQF